MTFKTILLGCGFALLTTASAHAVCAVTADGSDDEKAAAQRLARFSNSATVSGAYTGGTCTITKVLHGGGDPCPGTHETNHITLTVTGILGAYHVFNVQQGAGYCTTH